MKKEKLKLPKIKKKHYAKKIPVFGILLLIIGIIWILQDFALITIDIPWVPIIVILIALAIILKRMENS